MKLVTVRGDNEPVARMDLPGKDEQAHRSGLPQ
jgi:hypothetical protein